METIDTTTIDYQHYLSATEIAAIEHECKHIAVGSVMKVFLQLVIC
jgi:hypothetical protein